MSTITQTYTQTDIRRVCEMFQADLRMLAERTQAMDPGHAEKCGYDVCRMAMENCLKGVHIQLCGLDGNLVKVHRYSVKEDISSDSARPGGNRWPRLPNGTLHVIVIVEPSNSQKLENLKKSGDLCLEWGDSSLSTDYSNMQSDGARLYSSNSYGLQRDTFVN